MKNLKKNGGFTLVELIVVIAILAILAAVAVPAYSGYIEKANKAGDETLLATINKAFASACLENGFSQYDVQAASIPVNADGLVGTERFQLSDEPGYPLFISSIAVSNQTIDVKAFNLSFGVYFAGNESTAFKSIQGRSLYFVPALGGFVDPFTVDSVTVNYKGSNVTISSEALMNLKDSSFGSIGSEGLLNQIDFVSDMAAGMAGGSLANVFSNGDFIQSAMGALNITDPAVFNTKYQQMIETMAEEQDISKTEAQAKINANAAVLYAADNASKYTDDQISSLFDSNSETGVNILYNLTNSNGDTAKGMADAALVYGMYTAYANSAEYGNDTLKANANDAGTVLDALANDPDFLTYANSEQGKKDMAAYMDSLNVITGTADDPAVVEDLMINGYNNDDLKGIIGGIMG